MSIIQFFGFPISASFGGLGKELWRKAASGYPKIAAINSGRPMPVSEEYGMTLWIPIRVRISRNRAAAFDFLILSTLLATIRMGFFVASRARSISKSFSVGPTSASMMRTTCFCQAGDLYKYQSIRRWSRRFVSSE